MYVCTLKAHPVVPFSSTQTLYTFLVSQPLSVLCRHTVCEGVWLSDSGMWTEGTREDVYICGPLGFVSLSLGHSHTPPFHIMSFWHTQIFFYLLLVVYTCQPCMTLSCGGLDTACLIFYLHLPSPGFKSWGDTDLRPAHIEVEPETYRVEQHVNGFQPCTWKDVAIGHCSQISTMGE